MSLGGHFLSLREWLCDVLCACITYLPSLPTYLLASEEVSFDIHRNLFSVVALT